MPAGCRTLSIKDGSRWRDCVGAAICCRGMGDSRRTRMADAGTCSIVGPTLTHVAGQICSAMRSVLRLVSFALCQADLGEPRLLGCSGGGVITRAGSPRSRSPPVLTARSLPIMPREHRRRRVHREAADRLVLALRCRDVRAAFFWVGRRRVSPICCGERDASKCVPICGVLVGLIFAALTLPGCNPTIGFARGEQTTHAAQPQRILRSST